MGRGKGRVKREEGGGRRLAVKTGNLLHNKLVQCAITRCRDSLPRLPQGCSATLSDQQQQQEQQAGACSMQHAAYSMGHAAGQTYLKVQLAVAGDAATRYAANKMETGVVRWPTLRCAPRRGKYQEYLVPGICCSPCSPLSTRQVTHCGTFHKFFLERGWQLVCRMQMQLSETRATERQAGRGRQREAGRERQAERGRQREADSWLWECECSIDRSIVVPQLDFDQLCGPPSPGRTTPTPTQSATAASAAAPSAAPSTAAASS